MATTPVRLAGPPPPWSPPCTPPARATPGAVGWAEVADEREKDVGTPARLEHKRTVERRLRARWQAWTNAQAAAAADLRAASALLATSGTPPEAQELVARAAARLTALTEPGTPTPATLPTMQSAGPPSPLRGLAVVLAADDSSSSSSNSFDLRVVQQAVHPLPPPLAHAVADDVAAALTELQRRERAHASLCRLVLDHLCELADAGDSSAGTVWPGPVRLGWATAPGLATARGGGRDPARASPTDGPALQRLKAAFAGQAQQLVATTRPAVAESAVVSRRAREVRPHSL
jgi:hypothetical protein